MSERKEYCPFCKRAACAYGCPGAEPGRPPETDEAAHDAKPYKQYTARVGVAPGTTTLRLPDGTVISLREWLAGSYYSSMIIDPWREDISHSPTRLFSYGRAQMIPNTNKYAEAWHTNIPISGDCGLPRDWEGLVYGVRAETNQYSPAVWDWAAKTHVKVIYNQKTYFETSLLSLLKVTDPIIHAQNNKTEQLYIPEMQKREEALKKAVASGWTLPIHMRCHLAYEVLIESDPIATITLQKALRDSAEPNFNFREGIARLETIAKLSGGTVASEIARALEIMVPNRNGLLVRIHLDGLWCKPVF